MELRKVCVFDINETLFNLQALDGVFQNIFGASEFRHIWFQASLHASLSLTVTDAFKDFSHIQEYTLEAMGRKFGVQIDSGQKNQYTEALENLPAHPDVRPGLEALRHAGYQIVALTNSSEKKVTRLIEQNNLGEFFHRIFSVDVVQAYKPAPQAYDYVSTELKMNTEDLWMVASHDWDTHGAHSIGMKTGLLLRPGQALNAAYSKPDVQAETLPELVRLMLEKDGVETQVQRILKEDQLGPQL